MKTFLKIKKLTGIIEISTMLTLFLFVFSSCDDKIPLLEGKWKYSSQGTTYYDKDSFMIYKNNSVDEFYEDNSEKDVSIEKFIYYFASSDINDNDRTVTFVYEVTYIGTWEQDEAMIFLEGTSFTWKLVDFILSPVIQDECENDEESKKEINQFFVETCNVMQEHYSSLREEVVGVKRVLKIVDVNVWSNTITIEEDGETFDMKKEQYLYSVHKINNIHKDSSKQQKKKVKNKRIRVR